ncbi:hypothetical protein NF552_23235 (plasmid) [Roseomonas mucosa]|nr:hypothetical protein NF552_23235 [Roseomonas mucosa]
MLSTIYAIALAATIHSPVQQGPVIPAQILNFRHPPLRGRDTPGLSCRALINGDWVYASRSADPGSRIAFQRGAVAVTGPETDGFIPVLLTTGQRGWMLANVMQWHQPTNYVPHVGHCHATLLRNGAAHITWTDQ